MNWVTFLLLTLTLTAWAAPQKPGDPARGKLVFRQCTMCHTESGDKKIGPGLKGLFKRTKLVNGQKMTEAAVRTQIDNGSNNGMPAYKDMLSSREKDDLVAFLKSL